MSQLTLTDHEAIKHVTASDDTSNYKQPPSLWSRSEGIPPLGLGFIENCDSGVAKYFGFGHWQQMHRTQAAFKALSMCGVLCASRRPPSVEVPNIKCLILSGMPDPEPEPAPLLKDGFGACTSASF